MFHRASQNGPSGLGPPPGYGSDVPRGPGKLDKQARREARDAARVVAVWAEEAARVRGWTDAVHEDVRRRLADLDARSVSVPHQGAPTWRGAVLSRAEADGLVHALVARANLPRTGAEESAVLTDLTTRAPAALAGARVLSPVRWAFSTPGRRARAVPHATYLVELAAWGARTRVASTLERLAAPTGELDPTGLSAADLLDPRLGLAALVGGRPATLDGAWFGELPRAVADLRAAAAEEAPARAALDEAVAGYRAPAVRAALSAMPLDALADVTTALLQLAPLRRAGITAVQAVLDRRAELTSLPGIGNVFRDNLVGAARTLARVTADQQPVRLPGTPDPAAGAVVAALARWDGVRRTQGAGADLAIADDLAPLAAVVDDTTELLLVRPERELPASGLADAIATVVRRADLVAVTTGRGPVADPWADFTARPADYYALLVEAGYLTEDQRAGHGELPAGLVEAVREQALRTEALTVALRGYQSFGARFALVQRKVVLGDEMGLGKTIEALAVLAHLWATGATHFLVVCPPGVLVNWLREVAARSTLTAHRVHGEEWREAAAAWVADGGIAVTTYDTTWMESEAWAEGPRIACVVVDEAQYVKNPEAQRSQRVARLVAAVDHAILLTGTPMQNHVGEFRTLVAYLQPGLLAGLDDVAPRVFRRAVAPAYLRRSQEDVLTELPELVEVEEWLPLGPRDLDAYRAAVAAGNLMQMRRVAMLHGAESPKVGRLVEIVEEAEDNGRRVIVYSFFRDVLGSLTELLPGPVFGPLDGSVPAAARQSLIDDFSAAEGGAVLLAQVTTGGVGLNIQAASVVVLCEPQLNPALEAQAVARAHRMGQLHSVQVHRLLSEDAVDERITELLSHKRQLFEEYAATSVTADASPEATDAEIARQVVAAEQERLLYQPPAAPAPDDA